MNPAKSKGALREVRCAKIAVEACARGVTEGDGLGRDLFCFVVSIARICTNNLYLKIRLGNKLYENTLTRVDAQA